MNERWKQNNGKLDATTKTIRNIRTHLMSLKDEKRATSPAIIGDLWRPVSSQGKPYFLTSQQTRDNYIFEWICSRITNKRNTIQKRLRKRAEKSLQEHTKLPFRTRARNTKRHGFQFPTYTTQQKNTNRGLATVYAKTLHILYHSLVNFSMNYP